MDESMDGVVNLIHSEAPAESQRAAQGGESDRRGAAGSAR